MAARHDSIGIKQVVRLEWYDYTLDLLQQGLPAKEIRASLDEYIKDRLQSGGYGERGGQTYVKAITQLMKAWVTPAKELVPLRDAALKLSMGSEREQWPILHWAMTSAAYPFWYKVAEQVGRLLKLQPAINQAQIRQRCYEIFGERSTVERSARRVVRTFVSWGVLDETPPKGCYKSGCKFEITDTRFATLLLESALHTLPDGKASLDSLMQNPAFFPFSLPEMTGSMALSVSPRIDLCRYGLDNELMMLK